MRISVLMSALGLCSASMAQTATSVQDGLWEDPATWDCNCIPFAIDTYVDHTVQITTNTSLAMQVMQVNASGAITMDGPHSVAIMETVTNNGEMHLIGDIDIDGELINNNFITVEGDFHLDNLLYMGGPNTSLLITGNFVNHEGIVDGAGLICVSEGTQNGGEILGHVDICDGSPTVVDPPILDVNTGIVAATVVFCASGACTESVHELTTSPIVAYPNPAQDRIWIEGIPPGTPAQLIDALGRVTIPQSERVGDRVLIDLSAYAPGIYVLRAGQLSKTRAIPLVLIR